MFDVKHHHYEHHSGSKDYDLWMIYSRDTEKALLIRRWGKSASKGQSMQRIVNGKRGGMVAFHTEHEKRLKRGYDVNDFLSDGDDEMGLDGEQVLSLFRPGMYDGVASHILSFCQVGTVTTELTGELMEAEITITKEDVERPAEWGTW